MTTTSPMRAYGIGTAVSMGVYVIAVVLASSARNAEASTAVMFGLALLPGLAIVGHVVVVLRLMSRADEFVRAVTAKRFIVAAALTFAAGTVWGFLELYADAPDAPLYLIYAAFWGFYGAVTPFLRTSR